MAWRFDQVGLTGQVGNLAVCDVRASVQPRPGEPAQLVIEVGNFSEARQTVDLEVRIQDATYTARVTCEPWRSSHAVLSLPAEASASQKSAGSCRT